MDGSFPRLQLYHEPRRGSLSPQSPQNNRRCHISQPRPAQVAMFCHRHVYVRQDIQRNGGEEDSDNSLQDSLSTPLLFYTKPSSLHPCNVKLWLSSRTHSLIQRKDYGIPFEKAINVKEDENDLPRFFLSSLKLSQELVASLAPNFIMIHGEDILILPSSLNHLLNEDATDRKLPTIPLAESMYGVRKIITFHCTQWPENARQWPYRKRSWPSKEIISKIVGKGFHIIPAERHTAVSSDLWENEWRVSFVMAEEELINSLTSTQQMCYMVLKEVLLHNSDCQSLSEEHLKHALFWALEKESNTEAVSGDEVLPCLHALLQAIQPFFARCNLPHYFIPEQNLFADFSDKEGMRLLSEKLRKLSIQDIKGFFQPFLDLFELWDLKPEEILESLQTDIQTAISVRLQSYIQASFDEHVRLAYMKLYACVAAYRSVDLCIGKVKDSLQLRSGKSSRMLTPIREILTNILGKLFLLKAMQLKPSQERSFFANKAEECLLQTHNMDLLAGKVTLANFFYMTCRFADCIQLLKEVLQHGAQAQNHYSLEIENASPEQAMHDQLWFKWINKNYVFPFIVSASEKSVVPSIIKRNFELATCQLLGILPVSVSYLDPDIYAHMLLVLALIKIKHQRQALQHLSILENICEKEHEDTNEKRNVMYLNTVAHCYEELGERERAVHNLSRSLAILPNPRNSARWVLVGYQTERARTIIKGSIGAAAALGFLAMAITFVKGK